MRFKPLHLCYEIVIEAFLIVLLPNRSLQHGRYKLAQGLMLLSRQRELSLNLLSNDFGKIAFNPGKRIFEFVVLRPSEIKGVEVRFPKNILGGAPLLGLSILGKNPNVGFLFRRGVGV